MLTDNYPEKQITAWRNLTESPKKTKICTPISWKKPALNDIFSLYFKQTSHTKFQLKYL